MTTFDQDQVQAIVDTLVTDQAVADSIDHGIEHVAFRRRDITVATMIGSMLTVLVAYIVQLGTTPLSRQLICEAIVVKLRAELEKANEVT